MTGRRATLTLQRGDRDGHARRWWPTVLATLLVLTVGIAIGNRLGNNEPPATQRSAQEARPTVGADPPQPSTSRPVDAGAVSRTREGAAAAASAAISALELPVVLDEERLEATIAEIAAREYREPLLETYRAGAAAFREKLGIGSTPEPVVFVRTAPIGFRVERFSETEATVAVWAVGLIGSGATVTPQQNWSTQRVSLTWEGGGWKVSGFDRETGPTPPLARAEAADPPGALFQTIPSFEPYRHATP